MLILKDSLVLNGVLSGSNSTGNGVFFTTATQDPTGTGDANKIVVNFGSGGTTLDGNVTVAPTGIFTVNNESIVRFDVTFSFGRINNPGTAYLVGRFMYSADGNMANGIQIGNSFEATVQNGNYIQPYNINNVAVSMAQGSIFWFELARDDSGNNSGGLYTRMPSGTLATWNEPVTAQINFM